MKVDLKQIALKIIEYQMASPNFIMRQFEIDFNEAVKRIDELERLKIIGPFLGSRPREILMTKNQVLKAFSEDSTNLKIDS